MRLLRKIIQYTLAVLLALYVVLIFALDNSRVQIYIAQLAEEKLSETLGSKVEIDRVSIGLFNAVELHKVTLYDKKDKIMLHSDLIYGKVQLLPLLQGKISIRNISLLDGNIALYKDTADGDPNFKFVLDAFKSDKKKKKKPLDLTINSLLLRRCNLTYDDNFIPLPEGYRVDASSPVRIPFTPHHLKASDIDANISLKHLTDNDVNLRIRQLRFKERSGLEIKDFRAHLVADRHHADIQDFYLVMPESRLSQKAISADYDFQDMASLKSTLALSAHLQDVTVSTNDLAAFVPQLASLDEVVHVSTDISYKTGDVKLQRLAMSNEDATIAVDADVDFKLLNGRGLDLYIKTRRCLVEQTFVSNIFDNILHKPVPAALTAAGDVGLEGTLHYARSPKARVWAVPDSVALGWRDYEHKATLEAVINTALGDVDAELALEDLTLNASVKTTNLNLVPLAPEKRLPSLVDISIDGNAKLSDAPTDKLPLHIAGADADIALKTIKIGEATYENILASVDYNADQANIDLSVDNAMAKLHTTLSASLNAERPFGTLPHDIMADFDLERLSPSLLGLTDRYGSGVFSLKGNAEIASLDLAALDGQFSINDLTLTGDGHPAPYHLEHLGITATPAEPGNHVTLRSDFADLDYTGPVAPAELLRVARNIYNNVQQGMYEDESAGDVALSPASADRINLALLVRNGEFFNRILGTRLNYSGTIHALGNTTPDGRDLTLTVTSPTLSFGKFTLDNLSVYARNRDGAFNLLGKVNKKLKKGEIQVEMTAVNRDGIIATNIEWDETTEHRYYGQLCSNTKLDLPAKDGEQSHRLGFKTSFTPSTLCIGDTLWQVSNSTVDYHDNRVAIRDFRIFNGHQNLTINGNYDRTSNDTIIVSLNDIDLEYVLALARLNVVEFAGHATGNIYVRQLPNGDPWAKAVVNVPDITFNHAKLGNANVVLGWDHSKSDITLWGDIHEEGIGMTKVRGYVDPIHRDLDIQTESVNTQLAFLNKYTQGIFSDISGRATGNCRIYGGFQSIEFEGHETASCQATIPVTGVTYLVQDADVGIVPGAFNIASATIHDKYTGTGVASGRLCHNHIKDMTYDFKLSGSNLRLYDKPRELDMPFYATATGSGNVHIYGEPGKMNADIRIGTVAGSELTYILDSPDADVSQLITLHNAEASADDETASVNIDATSVEPVPTTDISLYFEVDVDDKSRLSLITDDKSGDAINVYGSGPIQATYHNKSGFRMYGTYNIDRGTYDLIIPSLAQRKRFEILPGGKVLFSGDPTEAEVNVKAQYVVNSASLADLNIGSGFANNTTRVNCLVDLFGEVANMQFNLNFELPNCSEDEQQMVRNLIASDEDRTMQVLYLLGVGRFYAYNYTATDIGQSQSVLMMNSLLSSTLSSQLNNIISNAVGNNNWSFGTNISTGQMGWSDMEVEGLVSSRLLNNRLLLNGNFGYSERQAATTNFVGDFDMQYLITPKGTVSVRAYSETNDRYFTKSTLTTQGVGLQLKKDFTRFLSLFRRKRQRQ